MVGTVISLDSTDKNWLDDKSRAEHVPMMHGRKAREFIGFPGG